MQDNDGYDPFAGMDLAAENARRGFGGSVDQFVRLELGKASADCAEGVLDHVLEAAVLQARAK